MTRTLLFWINTVCINQNDSNEKSSQVQQIGEICEAACIVLAWLGHTEDQSDAATNWIKIRSSWKRDDLDSSSSTALKALFSGKYWTQRWIAQEITLSCSLDFHCGNDTCDVSDLLSSSGKLRDEHGHAVFPSHIIYLLGIRDVLMLFLSFLMLTLKDPECSVIHDRVYALLARYGSETLFKTDYDDILYVLLRVLQTSLDGPEPAPTRFLADMLEINLTDSDIEIVSKITHSTVGDVMLQAVCRSAHETSRETCNSIVDLGIEQWCSQNSFIVRLYNRVEENS